MTKGRCSYRWKMRVWRNVVFISFYGVDNWIYLIVLLDKESTREIACKKFLITNIIMTLGVIYINIKKEIVNTIPFEFSSPLKRYKCFPLKLLYHYNTG